jgi:hypothetical protein
MDYLNGDRRDKNDPIYNTDDGKVNYESESIVSAGGEPKRILTDDYAFGYMNLEGMPYIDITNYYNEKDTPVWGSF